jgi:CRISPR-associated protein Csm3
MRFLAEWRLGKVVSGSVCNCSDDKCEICRIFGTANTDHENGPTRLLVRDSKLIGKYDPEKQIEVKYGTAINRLTGTAKDSSLRNMERVTPGTRFSFELVYRVFDMEDNGAADLERFGIVKKCLQWLENDTLGGSGSRGCGKIAFEKIRLSGLEQGEYENTDELLSEVTVAA